MLKSFLLVAAGGALGAMARYGAYHFLKSEQAWNTTLFINLLGCLLIGICWVAFPKTDWYLLVATGLLGGFTTYSAFGLELFQQLQEGKIATALLYSSSSLLGGTLAAWMGFLLGKLIFRT